MGLKVGSLKLALLLVMFVPALAAAQAPFNPVQLVQRTRTATVSGTVLYRQRIALPDNAVVIVKLQEVSRLDAPAVTIAEQTIETDGRQVPIPFELSYNANQINPSYTYVVQAQILVVDQVRWANTTAYRVITQRNPATVEILMQPANPAMSTEPSSPPVTESSSRYDCDAQVRSYKDMQNVDLESAQRLRLQRDGNRFVYQCTPTTARSNEFRYNCRAEIADYPNRQSVGLAEAERLLQQLEGDLFIYQCSPL